MNTTTENSTNSNSTSNSGANNGIVIDFPVILMFVASVIVVLCYAYTFYKMQAWALIVAGCGNIAGMICLIVLRARYLDNYYIPFAFFHLIMFTIIVCKTATFFYVALKMRAHEMQIVPIEIPVDDKINKFDIFETAYGH